MLAEYAYYNYTLQSCTPDEDNGGGGGGDGGEIIR